MKPKYYKRNFLLPAALCSLFIFAITGCGSEDQKASFTDPDSESSEPQTRSAKVATSNKPAHKIHDPFDHSHDRTVTNLEKHKFEHDFSEQCVDREIANSANPDVDKQRFGKDCMCIATYMMKDLTAIEAEKFLEEHKSTQSLRIRFENAAFHCLQQKVPPKSPNLFGRR